MYRTRVEVDGSQCVYYAFRVNGRKEQSVQFTLSELKPAHTDASLVDTCARAGHAMVHGRKKFLGEASLPWESFTEEQRNGTRGAAQVVFDLADRGVDAREMDKRFHEKFRSMSKLYGWSVEDAWDDLSQTERTRVSLFVSTVLTMRSGCLEVMK